MFHVFKKVQVIVYHMLELNKRSTNSLDEFRSTAIISDNIRWVLFYMTIVLGILWSGHCFT